MESTYHPPIPDAIISLRIILPIFKEMLDYCAYKAVEDGNIAYDGKANLIIYRTKVEDWDQDLFDTLIGVDEIWILQAGPPDTSD